MRTIPAKESLTVEFKSDRKPLPESELVAAAVCLANTDGGELYLGVEDDGTITGIDPSHRDSGRLAALIANRTSPPVAVSVVRVEENGRVVQKIVVPRATGGIAATSAGVVLRRRLDLHGKPECVPFLPHEFMSRRAELGLLDPSATVLVQAGVDDLDPIERIRLRRVIEQNPLSDKGLLKLADEELDGALGLTRSIDGRVAPTLAGMLILGKEGAIREHVPTHEIAFQVLEGSTVKVNEFFRWPLLRAFERVEEMFTARLDEQEVMIGLYRIGIPRVDRTAFREALANALVHRDYARVGAVHVQWASKALTISSPGGFVAGVSLENLLVTPPMPRNPRLADAFKRLGLVERSGRGVDRIYEGLLRYGRPAPDYSLSTVAAVVVSLSTTDADIPFFRMVQESEQRRGEPHQADVLVALSTMRELRRVTAADVAARMQRPEARARAVLEELVEAGLAERHGQNRDRAFTLSARVYQELDLKAEYLRQTRPELQTPEEQILAFVRAHGAITRSEVKDYCGVDDNGAKRILRKLVSEGVLRLEGTRRWARYRTVGQKGAATPKDEP